MPTAKSDKDVCRLWDAVAYGATLNEVADVAGMLLPNTLQSASRFLCFRQLLDAVSLHFLLRRCQLRMLPFDSEPQRLF